MIIQNQTEQTPYCHTRLTHEYLISRNNQQVEMWHVETKIGDLTLTPQWRDNRKNIIFKVTWKRYSRKSYKVEKLIKFLKKTIFKGI